MIFNELEKENGDEKIIIPEGFYLTIAETSQNVYGINLTDSEGRSIKNHGTDLYDMVEKAIEDLIKLRK